MKELDDSKVSESSGILTNMKTTVKNVKTKAKSIVSDVTGYTSSVFEFVDMNWNDD